MILKGQAFEMSKHTPPPFTNRCPTTLVDVDDLEDLKETERDAIA